MRLPFSVQVFLLRIVGDEPSYLLFHRNERPELRLPGFWQGLSGALEAGESFASAALREVHEETGISLASKIDTSFSHCYPVRSEWRRWYGPTPQVVEEHVFYATVAPSTQPVLSPEHKSWRWCPFEEANTLLTFGANAACLQAVARSAAASMPNKAMQPTCEDARANGKRWAS
jgi:8-oxo-dGTP pyrophosphatase MutT (NUDIX family)